jgi:hypothetical protein
MTGSDPVNLIEPFPLACDEHHWSGCVRLRAKRKVWFAIYDDDAGFQKQFNWVLKQKVLRQMLREWFPVLLA